MREMKRAAVGLQWVHNDPGRDYHLEDAVEKAISEAISPDVRSRWTDVQVLHEGNRINPRKILTAELKRLEAARKRVALSRGEDPPPALELAGEDTSCVRYVWNGSHQECIVSYGLVEGGQRWCVRSPRDPDAFAALDIQLSITVDEPLREPQRSSVNW